MIMKMLVLMYLVNVAARPKMQSEFTLHTTSSVKAFRVAFFYYEFVGVEALKYSAITILLLLV